MTDTPAPYAPGLRYGVVVRPPEYRLSERAFRCSPLLEADITDTGQGDDVAVVVQGNFVGVVADSLELARASASRLSLRWGAAEQDDRTDITSRLMNTRLHATYHWPGRLSWGPRAGWVMADFSGDAARVRVATTDSQQLRRELALLMDCEPERIAMETDGESPLGRHCGDDAVADAALLSRAVGQPVAVWLDSQTYGGDVEALRHARRMRFSGDPGDASFRLEADQGRVTVPVLALWLTGRLHDQVLQEPDAAALQYHFAQESFLDEIAIARGQDPVTLRLRHIQDRRGRQLLTAVADQAQWPTTSTGEQSRQDLLRGRGVAYSHRPGTSGTAAGPRSAWIADVEVNTVTGTVTLARLIAGQDAGDDGPIAPLLDPAPLRQALEQKLLGLPEAPTAMDDWAAEDTATPLATRTTTPPARPHQANTPATAEQIDLTPAVAVVANALYDATGVRFRSPPFSPARVRAALHGRNTPRRRRWWWAGGLAVSGLLAALWPWPAPLAPVARPAANLYSEETIERGRLVAEAGDCAVCHTAEEGATNTGGRPFETPFGVLYSTNLTPDPDTGIGRWSYTAFERAMREGIARDGRHLYPAFPYTAFAKMSDADIQALYAYLMAQPAASAVPPNNRLRFPFNVRSLMAGWNVFFHRDQRYQPDTTRTAQWNRGAYLFEGAGHCSACHTPRNLFGAEKSGDAYLSGALVDGWEAPPLTANNRAPVPWTEDELFHYLRSGRSEFHGVAGGPMAPVVAGLARLPEADVRAIAHYLASQMGAPTRLTEAQRQQAQDKLAANATEPAGLDSGRRVFDGACASCHTNDAPTTFTSARQALALNTNLHSERADNVIQSILGGVHVQGGTGAGEMPAFSHSLSDRQITDLVAYLRARFAPGETPWKDIGKTVETLRREHDQQS